MLTNQNRDMYKVINLPPGFPREMHSEPLEFISKEYFTPPKWPKDKISSVHEKYQKYFDIMSKELDKIEVIEVRENPEPEKDDNNMDWQKKYFDKIDENISDIKSDLKHFESRISSIVEQGVSSNTQLLSQIQHMDNQRHSELVNLRKESEKKYSDLTNKIEATHNRLLYVALAIAGLIIAAAGAVGYFG